MDPDGVALADVDECGGERAECLDGDWDVGVIVTDQGEDDAGVGLDRQGGENE